MNAPAMSSILVYASPSLAPAADDARRVTGSVFVIGAAVTLGLALQVNYGQFHPIAITWLGVSVVFLFLALRASAGVRRSRLERPVLAMAALLQFVLQFGAHPGVAELGPTPALLPFRAGIVLAAIVTFFGIVGPQRVRITSTVLMLLLHLMLGVWTLRALPTPTVDVLTFQREGCAALVDGKNPYAITFPDESPAGSHFYGDGLSRDGRLQFGYPYPPIPLLMTLPAYLAGDLRIVHLVALTMAGALIAFSRPGWRASGAAALLLFTPRGFFVLQAGWIEPIVELGLAAVVFVACRLENRKLQPVSRGLVIPRSDSNEGSRVGETARFRRSFVAPLLGMTGMVRGSGCALACAVGLFLFTKQYLVLALPACLLLPNVGPAERPTRRWLATLPLPVLIVFPFVLWNPSAFLHSVAFLQFHQPPRSDALSLLSPLILSFPSSLTTIVPFLAAAAVLWFACRRLPKSASSFSLAIAATFVVFFALNKQAFCNYYHFVLAAECAALASISDAKSPII